MPENAKRVTEIPTIDVVLILIEAAGATYALDTASKIGVEPEVETEEAVKLVIKGKLKAQKGEETTITGNLITLTDNVFSPELVKVLQGGTIKYWTSSDKTTEGTDVTSFGVSSYTPPTVGSGEKGEVFKLHAFSAQYDAAGLITQYEQITYPNCKGTPVSLSSEDGVFRVAEYKIHSAPKKDEAPYSIHYVSKLPTVS